MGNEGRHIPNILRKNRRSKGITQNELAKYLKMKKSNQISLWEKGLTNPSLKNALLLHLFFQLPTDAFFDEYIEELRIEYKTEIEEFIRKYSL